MFIKLHLCEKWQDELAPGPPLRVFRSGAFRLVVEQCQEQHSTMRMSWEEQKRGSEELTMVVLCLQWSVAKMMNKLIHQCLQWAYKGCMTKHCNYYYYYYSFYREETNNQSWSEICPSGGIKFLPQYTYFSFLLRQTLGMREYLAFRNWWKEWKRRPIFPLGGGETLVKSQPLTFWMWKSWHKECQGAHSRQEHRPSGLGPLFYRRRIWGLERIQWPIQQAQSCWCERD